MPHPRTPDRRLRVLLLLALTLVGFSAGFGAMSQITRRERVGMPPQGGVLNPPPLGDLNLVPSPSLRPEQVVASQMRSLVDYRTDRAAIHRVYAYASPANKAALGPVGRFERLILNPPYKAMIVCEQWVMGRAVEQEDLATVMVTLRDRSGRVSAYRFYLSRQSDELEGCWMTDRVHCVLRAWRPGEPEPPLGGPEAGLGARITLFPQAGSA